MASVQKLISKSSPKCIAACKHRSPRFAAFYGKIAEPPFFLLLIVSRKEQTRNLARSSLESASNR